MRIFFGGFNHGFDWLADRYKTLATKIVRFAVVMLAVYVAILAFGLNEFRSTPQGFIPQIDRGILIVASQLPPGASLQRTDEVMRKATEIVQSTPGVSHSVVIVGFSGATFTNAPNAGAMFVVLDPFDERAKDPAKATANIQRQLFQKLGALQEAFMIVVQPPPVSGIGNAAGFRMMIEDRLGAGPQALQGAVYAMMGRAAQTQGLQQVYSLFETATPQLFLDIDRTKAQLLGINIGEVFSALQVYVGSAYVNDFNLFGRTFRVQVQADAAHRLEPKDVLALRVRNSAGDSVPLGSFTTVNDISGPYRTRWRAGARLQPGRRHRGDAETRRRNAAARFLV